LCDRTAEIRRRSRKVWHTALRRQSFNLTPRHKATKNTKETF
jgi:hypothetical protein